MRVRILVDFWNLQLAWNDFHERQGRERPRIPWETGLPEVLTRHAETDGIYAGCHVYASVDPRNERDAGLRRFLHAMNGFRSAYRCQHAECRRQVLECPHCGRELKGTVEKGVDTALATDLVQAALDDMYDSAILMSADADSYQQSNSSRTAQRSG